MNATDTSEVPVSFADGSGVASLLVLFVMAEDHQCDAHDSVLEGRPPMISVSLQPTPDCNVSVAELADEALSAVIAHLADRGYTVLSTDGSDDHQRCLAHYRVGPGAATLSAMVDDTDRGHVHIELTGPAFGKHVAGHNTDPVIWMLLVGLGVALAEAHCVRAQVSDPDLDEQRSPA
ncbi:hypothetical protein [Mycobacterium aquaticum]|uniref:hypothetical protein n=1 Tax=Mycobacterium aquaticum TaxID=1927124 RepID=UPI00114D53C4|nr:hypothetical protein [Mycobacterium aquaticum]